SPSCPKCTKRLCVDYGRTRFLYFPKLRAYSRKTDVCCIEVRIQGGRFAKGVGSFQILGLIAICETQVEMPHVHLGVARKYSDRSQQINLRLRDATHIHFCNGQVRGRITASQRRTLRNPLKGSQRWPKFVLGIKEPC